MRKFFNFIWDIIKIVVIALAIVAPIRYFLFQPFFVSGQSMEPNFKNGDYLIIDEISYRFELIKRGDVVVFRYPLDPSQRFIKRVVGLPGETVEIKDEKIIISKNGESWILDEKYIPESNKTVGQTKTELGSKEYFVMGDNREFSYDSRKFGPLPFDKIIGKVFLRALPINSFDIYYRSVAY